MENKSKKRIINYVSIGIMIFIVLVIAVLCILFTPMKVVRLIQEKATAIQIGAPVAVESISAGKYAYQRLDEDGRACYDQILNCILNHDESVSLSTKDEETLKLAFEYIFSDYGGLFWVDGYQYQTYHSGDYVTGILFFPSYIMSYDERVNRQGQIDQVADTWLAEAPLEGSDYEKVKYVYEKLIREVDYDTASPNNQNIISVFVNKSTVCQGYAMSATYLLSQMGIRSSIITGTANGQPHAWNLVEEDGEYYFVDVTWGNSTYRDANFDAKMTDYAYLNATTMDLANTHISNMKLQLPECSSTDNNYFVREGKFFDTWLPDGIGNSVGAAFSSGAESASVRFRTDAIYDACKDYFFTNKHFSDYCPGLSAISYFEDPELNVITFKFR